MPTRAARDHLARARIAFPRRLEYHSYRMKLYSGAWRLTHHIPILCAIGIACGGNANDPSANGSSNQRTGNPTGPCADAPSIQKNVLISGAITSACILGDTGTAQYRLTLSSFENDRLILSTGTAVLDLIDASGRRIAVAQTPPNQGSVASVLLSAGNYMVRLQGAVGTGFSLLLDNGKTPIVGCPAVFMGPGADFDGAVDAQMCGVNDTMFARFAVYVSKGRTLSIQARDGDTNVLDSGMMSLVGPSGAVVATAAYDAVRRTYALTYSNSDVPAFYVVVLSTHSPAWTYHLTVSP